MSRTPNSTNTPRPANNYAQVAAAQPTQKTVQQQQQPIPQRQQQQQQIQPNQQAHTTVVSANTSSSKNGKSTQKTQPQQNASITNGSSGRVPGPSVKQSSIPKNAIGVSFQNISSNALPINNPTPITFGSLDQTSGDVSLSSSPVQNSTVTGGKVPPQISKTSTPVFGTLNAPGTSEELAHSTPTQQTPTTLPAPGPNTYSGPGRPTNPRTIVVDFPQTQPAPPQLNLQDSTKNNNQPVGHQSPAVTSNRPAAGTNQQQSTTNTPQVQTPATPRQQQQQHTIHEPPHHRKDSVSSTVSSNDGQQQNQSYHPHPHPHQHPHPHHPHPHPHPQTHHQNHNNNHNHYGGSHHTRQQHHSKPGGIGPGPAGGQGISQYNNRPPRDKNSSLHIPPSPHLNPAQPQVPSIPMTAQPGMMPWASFRPNEWYSFQQFYEPHFHGYIYHPQIAPQFVNVAQRVPVAPQTTQPYISPSKASKAIPIIHPETKQEFVSKSSIAKKEEPSSPVAANLDTKKSNEPEKEKVKQENSSKALRIVDPEEKAKEEKREREEKEKKEREERERREREEQERQERQEREEQERKEREERERQEREEQERREREERERQEREEQERREREERERQEREEQEKREREERERILREEQERKEREERERREREEQERREREERERQEREEQERKEREERERILREEQERKEREERERQEREERERKEREERERILREEQERREREERERREREEQERKEREEREREEQERKEKEEKERLETQRKKEEAKAAEEAEKKRESELSNKKETKKEEKKHGKGHRPGPLDLSNANNPDVPAAPLSALGSARNIEDINSVQYPSGVLSPNPALNANAEPGKFKYDRDFLMQFMGVCTEKPENLPALDAIGMEESKEDKKGRGPGRSSSGSSSGRAQHKGSPGQSSYTNMNEFKPPKDSNERFAQSTMRMNMGPSGGFSRSSMPPRASSNNPILPPNNSTSQPSSPGRASSQRQTNRDRDRDRQDKRRTGHSQPGAPTIPLEQVTPLEHSENRWVPSSVTGPQKQPSEDIPSTETVQRKVKALLNKLTLERFESISDQIIEYANKSRDERDGRILKQVIQLTFLKACDESNFSQMYAQLCRKMMERVDPQILDEGVKNAQGYVQGGTLFRKYLLNRCQEDFERGWKSNVPVPANEEGEPDILSDEYYAAVRAKRMGLGLIKFIGELFKLNMLTERIMHECVKKLLSNVSSPEEEETESLCKLLTTVGKQLDHPKAKEHMDAYFTRMNKMAENTKLSSRIKFMILDVIDLRENNWVPRRDNNAPKTLAEIHEDAAKQKEEAELLRRTTSSGGRGLPRMADQLTRGGSGRRDKGVPHGANAPTLNADGWSTVGGSSSASKKQDLSKFGSLTRTKVPNFLAPGGGAFSVLRNSKPDSRDRDERPTPGRTSTAPTTTNPYSVLTHAESEGRKSLDGPSSESSKTTGSSTTTERPKLNLLPRTIGGSTQIKSGDVASKPGSPPTKSSSLPATTMSSEQAEKKMDSMIEEYWSVLDTKEFEICVKELPSQYRSEAIKRIFLSAIEKKQRDVDNATKLFNDLSNSESAITKSDFIKVFTEAMPIIEDLSPDIPLVYSFTGQFMYNSKLDLKDITELALKLDNSGLEPAPAKVVVAYLKTPNESENALMRKIKEFSFDIKTVFPKGTANNEINKFLDKYGLPELKR